MNRNRIEYTPAVRVVLNNKQVPYRRGEFKTRLTAAVNLADTADPTTTTTDLILLSRKPYRRRAARENVAGTTTIVRNQDQDCETCILAAKTREGRQRISNRPDIPPRRRFWKKSPARHGTIKIANFSHKNIARLLKVADLASCIAEIM